MTYFIECLVNAKYLKDLSTSGLVFPSNQPSPQSSFHGTSPSPTNETHATASTRNTTPEDTTPEKTRTAPPEPSATANQTCLRSATTIKNIWLDPDSKNVWLDPIGFSAATDTTQPGFPATLKNIWLDQTDSSQTTDSSRPGFATATKMVSARCAKATAQKNHLKPKPEQSPLEIDERLSYPDPIAVYKRYRSLSRVDQLEYFVKIKIKTFREHLGVYVPLYTRQSCIDEEEDKRRRNFFEKNGEEAYWARYIDSDYTGHVEFLYIDPNEV